VEVQREGTPSFDYPAYLEAKYTIDSASLNASVFAQFRGRLRHTINPRILDLGTGTGAMLRRLLELELAGQVQLIGLDQEEQNLAAGVYRIEQALRSGGYSIGEQRQSPEAKSIRGSRRDGEIRIELLRGDLLDPRTTGKLEPFDCITAHAFMDLMPLKRALTIIRTLLTADGVFYSTLNYDGLTVLLPEFENPGFERRLLQIYDRSMERRRSAGRKTGGSMSGRRLYGALLAGGFAILGMGSSDWNVFPSEGVYTEEQRLFLTAMLSMIEGEARRLRRRSGAGRAAGGDPIVDPQLLADWYADRLEAVQNNRLSLLVHQLDLLAKPA
jgi:SAM-dependent methyltransferase